MNKEQLISELIPDLAQDIERLKDGRTEEREQYYKDTIKRIVDMIIKKESIQ